MKSQSKYEKLYKPADTYFGINLGDKDLRPIYISLPSPPENIHKIDGYGLHPDDQFFKRVEIPQKITNLEKKVFADAVHMQRKRNHSISGFKVMNAFWDEIDNNQDYYSDEIAFMKKVWWHRLNGYWFYNDGKPTYITGRHYSYLNFWYMDDVKGNYPEYRDRNRREWLFREYCRTTTETFEFIDPKTGAAIDNEQGKLLMKDVGRRVCFGDIQPKSRRSGASNQGAHDVMETVMIKQGGTGTIVSKDGDSARKIYDKMMIPAFTRLPLFLRPIWEGNLKPNSLEFSVPSNHYGELSLGAVITYTDSADEVKNDGDKIHAMMADEQGKLSGRGVDVFERHNVNKQGMSLGNGSEIIGYITNPSTVEDMDEGGSVYMSLNNLSNFYVRNADGQTQSGLFRMFFPAQDGLEGFVDKFGMSVIDTPDDRQIMLKPKAVFAQEKIGSKDYLQRGRDSLLQAGDPDSMKQFRSIRKKQPMCYAECWMGTSGDLGMPIEIIDTRMAELRRQSKTVVGNFEWLDGIRDGRVVFVPRDDGRFELSKILDQYESNRKYQEGYYDIFHQDVVPHYYPEVDDRFVASCDPYDYANKSVAELRSSRTRLSDGGIAVFWLHDKSHKDGIDDHDRISEYESCRYVLTYRYRHDTVDDFNEDVLMSCVYFGAPLFPENNKTSTIEYFVRRGYGGYLMHDIDEKGALKDKPGFFSLEKSKNDLFTYLRDHFVKRGHKECHMGLMQEAKEITGIEYMKNFDLLTAAGGCQLAARSRIRQAKDNISDLKNRDNEIPDGLIDVIRGF